jgi:hypothetical protein
MSDDTEQETVVHGTKSKYFIHFKMCLKSLNADIFFTAIIPSSLTNKQNKTAKKKTSAPTIQPHWGKM